MFKKLIIPILVFVCTSIFWIYILLQSKSSTAGIGIIFIPVVAGLPAVLAFYAQKTQNKFYKVALVISIFLVLGKVYQMMLEQKKYNEKVALEAKQSEKRFEDSKHEIAILISKNIGNEVNVLNELFDKKPNREMTMAILSSKYCPPEKWLEYAASEDMGFALVIAQNNDATKEALELIYKKQKYPDFFISSLARNPNTSPELLRELYNQRHKNNLIEINLYNNPNTPEEIRQLMENASAE